MNLFHKIFHNQFQQQIDTLRPVQDLSPPRDGWIKTIRKVLGMSSYQLARRMKISQSALIGIEKREGEKTVTLKTLEETAQALNCRLVYAFIPQEPFQQMIEKQAQQYIKQQVQPLHHTMSLEQQGLTPEQRKAYENDLIQDILRTHQKKIWDVTND